MIEATNINPYLVDAADALLPNRSKPICDVPPMGIGNKPIDDGNYLFTTEERDAFIASEPTSAKWFRRWLGSTEFLNGIDRWCLWLGECSPGELRAMPEALKRVEAVRKFRLESSSEPTRKLADMATRFHVENIPPSDYLLIPRHSSESRSFIPMGFINPSVLSGDANLVCRDATIFHFGLLHSTMHMAWVRNVCGRIKSDYRYSAGIVYNNFPWPEAPSDKARMAIEDAAQEVLDARAQFPDATLADLFQRAAHLTLLTLRRIAWIRKKATKATKTIERIAVAAASGQSLALKPL
jgi:hypothetical protein